MIPIIDYRTQEDKIVDLFRQVERSDRRIYIKIDGKFIDTQEFGFYFTEVSITRDDEPPHIDLKLEKLQFVKL